MFKEYFVVFLGQLEFVLLDSTLYLYNKLLLNAQENHGKLGKKHSQITNT